MTEFENNEYHNQNNLLDLEKENIFLWRILIIYFIFNLIGLMINPIWFRTLYALMLLPFLAMFIIFEIYAKKFKTQLANVKDELEKNKLHKLITIKIIVIIIGSMLLLNPLFYFDTSSGIGDILVKNKQYEKAKVFHNFSIKLFNIPFLFSKDYKRCFLEKKAYLYFSNKQYQISDKFYKKLIELNEE